MLKFQDKESLSNAFGLGGLHDFGPRMLDKTLGGIWSQPDVLTDFFESQSPYLYLRGSYLNMIDPTGMAGDSLVNNKEPGMLPGGPTTPKSTSESIPLNQYQVPSGSARRDNTSVSSFRQTPRPQNQTPQYQGSKSYLNPHFFSTRSTKSFSTWWYK